MNKLYFPAVVLLTCAASSPALGFHMKLLDVEGQTVKYSRDSGANYSDNVTAGRFEWSVKEGGSYGGTTFSVGDTIHTFCVELTQTVTIGGHDGNPALGYDYDLVSPDTLPTSETSMTPFRAGLLTELFQDQFLNNVSSSSDLSDLAAFQIAVWEIVFQAGIDDAGDLTGLNVDSGDFQIKGTIDTMGARGTANAWLAALDGDVDLNNLLIGFSSDGHQDQVTMVPIPAPLGLAAIGLAGVIVGRRRLSRIVDPSR